MTTDRSTVRCQFGCDVYTAIVDRSWDGGLKLHQCPLCQGMFIKNQSGIVLATRQPEPVEG